MQMWVAYITGTLFTIMMLGFVNSAQPSILTADGVRWPHRQIRQNLSPGSRVLKRVQPLLRKGVISSVCHFEHVAIGINQFDKSVFT